MKIIELTKGYKAIVDDQDYDSLIEHHWSITSNGYAKRCIFSKSKGLNKTILMHIEIIQPKKGEWVDHINHNKLDNRINNLRICNASSNAMNMEVHKNSKSGYKGVHFEELSKKWRASIRKDGKRIWLGGFDTPIEAAYAYNQAAIKYYGEFAYINPI